MSFQQGLSALNAASKNLEVIGNNVANANTYGAKASRAEFADVYATAINGTGTSSVGIGVNLSTVSQQFTQGTIVSSSNPLDLAINGAGFFQLSDGVNPPLYTRNGQFQVDRDGYVVNAQGNRLMGYPADATGTIQTGATAALRLPTAGIAPSASTKVELEMNLDSRAEPTLPAAAPLIDLSNSATYNNATSLTAFDAKGQEVALTFYFQKAAADRWNVYVSANGAPLATDAAGNPVASTTIAFAPDGSAPTAPTGPVTLSVPSITDASGATTVAIPNLQLSLGNATQYGSTFAVTDLSQDGYPSGQLTGVQFEANGVVTARYSNGQSKPGGQVEIATFRNPQGLRSIGGNAWARTLATGEPIVGVPGDGSLGALQAGALEESNVDLTAELVNMITAQRVYQANAQTIKTQDQALQSLLNLR